MRIERDPEGQARPARIGAAVCFLLTGIVSATWASRVPAIKDGLGLGDGEFGVVLLLPALAPSLLMLAASLFVFAVLNSVVDVAMNAQGVAVGQLTSRPVLSGLHAMHSLGGA